MVPKTTDVNVFPRINSRMLPMICSNPPMKRYAPMFAAPNPPAPLQPIRSQPSGKEDTTNPARALFSASV